MNIREILEKISILEKKLQDSEFIKNPSEYQNILREYNLLKPLKEKGNRIIQIEKELADIEIMMEKEEEEKEMKKLIEQEKKELEQKKNDLEMEIKRSLIPKDPFYDKNCILEIRAGTGGEEAALFANDLFKMYLKYAEKKKWKVSITDLHQTELGGIREAILLIEGKSAYGNLKYESGVHRVQRIPLTETGGRIHTSTASVVVLPETEQTEIQIKPEELKIETKRAGGPGGQHMQKTDSAVRITHIPTGIVVQCQDERSQHKNKEKAMRILKSRIHKLEQEKREEKEREKRKFHIGTQERSEKIRTYNFPQGRVTDHRINITLYNIEEIMEGNIEPLIEKLKAEEEERMLKEI